MPVNNKAGHPKVSGVGVILSRSEALPAGSHLLHFVA